MFVNCKWTSLIFLFFINVVLSKKLYINAKEVEICREKSNLSKNDADTMIQPQTIPKTRDEMCFLKCFYGKHLVGASGKYEVQVNEDDPYNVSVNDETARSTNNVVKTCIKHATYKDKSEEACELGLITRLCHQQYSRIITQVIADLIDRNDQLAKEQPKYVIY